MFHLRRLPSFLRLFTSKLHDNSTVYGRVRIYSSDTDSGDKKVICERSFYLNEEGNSFFNVKTRFMKVRLSSAELDANLFKISVLGGRRDDVCCFESDSNWVGVKCHVDTNGKNVTVTGNGMESHTESDRFVLQLQIPPDSNIDVVSDDDVTLSPMQLKTVKCNLRKGVFGVRNLKCETLNVTSDDSGSVNFEGFILGNVRIGLKGDGNVVGALCQGSVIKFGTENGFIRVKALYCDDSEIRSNNGAIHIDNLSGSKSTVVVQQADANIVCLDGSIDLCVKKGNANVYISRMQSNLESSVRSEEGDVKLSFSELIQSWVRFEGQELKIQDGIEGERTTNPSNSITVFQGMLSKSKIMFGPMITASAPNGTVTVEILDWFHRITMGASEE